MLEHKIPPPLITLIVIGGIYGSSKLPLADSLAINPPLWLAIVFALIGLAIMLSGALEFRRAKTTVNPLNPEQATELVINGVFKRTRNPMYLGMSLIIVGATLLFGNLIGVGWMMGFMLYIQVFQIRPEEKAMKKLFGEQFEQYCKQVRRWV